MGTDFFEREHDLIIVGGTVIDPKTELITVGDVVVDGGKISGVTRVPLKARRKIDASGLIVCPGFVDPHSHADGQLFSAHVMASMGVTTIVVGSCGLGPYPAESFLKRLDKEGYPLNNAALSPVSWTLREKVGITDPYAVATDKEIAQMVELIEEDFHNGAVGVSLGLEYAPKTSWAEMEAVAKVAAKYDKVVPIHSRAGGWSGIEATREMIRLQEMTGARILISHHVYQCGQGMLEESLKTIEKARRQGYDIAVDSGAYADFACPIGSEVFCEGWRDIYDCDYRDILVGGGEYAGQRMTEELFNKLRKEDPDLSVTAFVGKEYEIGLTLNEPYTMISTDGGFNNLEPGKGHPQSAGTYPKIMAQLVREQNILTWMEFVKKSSWMPAQLFGFKDKGWIGEGADADITVFNPKTVKDKAAFAGYGDPMAAPEGIEHVFIHGESVVEDGAVIKDARPGKSIFSEADYWRL